MNKRILSVFGTALFIASLVSSAWGYEKEIEQLSEQMAAKIAAKGKNTVAVVDFTDLEGNVTQLDRFIAEEFSVALAGAGKGFRVIDRTNLKIIIKENNLSATGLIDPATARQLGMITGVDALVTGTLTSFGDNVHLTVKVLDSNTADIIDSAKVDIAKTPAIDELLGKEIPAEIAVNPSIGVTENVEDKKAVMSQVVKDILFELKECKVSGTALTCRLTATNKKGSDKVIRIHNYNYENRIFDNMSNEHKALFVEFANKRSSRSVRHMLISEVKTRLDFIFEGIDSKASKLALFELTYKDENNNALKVQFRDVPISK